MTLQTAVGSTAFNLSEPPARCPEADQLRLEWYGFFSEDGGVAGYALDMLQEHTAHCYPCLRRNTWFTERARVAVHPDLTAEEIERA